LALIDTRNKKKGFLISLISLGEGREAKGKITRPAEPIVGFPLPLQALEKQ
jgi:hypothetical protein